MTSKTPVRVAEDVDENTLSYSEIKALATGNPLIKEKMDLENELVKLRMLEANFKSNKYSLEDNIHTTYPRKIEMIERNIERVKKDLELVEPLGTGENKFTSMTVQGIAFSDKKEAGEALLNAVKSIKLNDPKIIGSYRGFEVEASYNFMTNAHHFSLKGNYEYHGELGVDAIGNITRMDNSLEKISHKLEELMSDLDNIKHQLDIAKEEVNKSFEKSDELKMKVLRLAEINQSLDMELDDDGGYEALVKTLKDSILDYLNSEYLTEDEASVYELEENEKGEIELAFTTTPDGGHDIQFNMNIKKYYWAQYIDDTLIRKQSYIEADGEVKHVDIEEALRAMIEEVKMGSHDDFVSVDEDDLFNALGLRIDEDGIFYDSLSEDRDNDNVADRYDADFRDSRVQDIGQLDQPSKPSTLEILDEMKHQVDSYDNSQEKSKIKSQER